MSNLYVCNYIDGQWVDSSKVGRSISPATGEVLGTFADGGATEAEASIAAARRTFDTTQWSRSRTLRAKTLFEIADRLEAVRDDIVTLLARENGKTLADAAFEIDLSIPKLRYYGALALTDTGRSGEVSPGMYSATISQAAGVAGVIAPWNSPVVLSIRSFAPALSAGCTVVLKLPAQTALVNAALYDVIAGAPSLPVGVFNMFTESGNDGAPIMVADPQVDVVSYTGSTGVGRIIMGNGAERLKPMSLELGGKTPMIVFDDADLDVTVPILTKAVTTFSGQFCMTGSRILVQAGVADELRRRLTESFEAVRLGPGDSPDSDMGPVIDISNAERIDKTVADAAEYATFLVRGGRPAGGEFAGGAYFHPSLLEVEDPRTPIVQKEVFGPVATFEVFTTEREAVTKANATDYGLAASIWTRDVDRPLRVGRELDVGTVWTNNWAVVHDLFEEGGFKQSGVGRLNGVQALREFQEVKHFVHQVDPLENDD